MCGGWVGHTTGMDKWGVKDTPVFKEIGDIGTGIGKGLESIGQGVVKGDIGSIAAAALLVTAVVNPGFLIYMAGEIGAAVGLEGAAAVAAGGAVMGGTAGALSGTAKGGDAIWKNAVTGAVTTAAAMGIPGGDTLSGAIGKGAVAGALGGTTSAALSGKSIGETALKGGGAGAITSGLAYGGAQLGEKLLPTQYADYYNPEEGAFRYDPSTKNWNQVATYDEGTGQYVTPEGTAYTPQTTTTSYGQNIGSELGKTAGRLANQELFPTQTTQYSGGTATGSVGGGGGGGVDQVLFPQIGAGSGALAQALRSTPTGAIGGGGVEPSGGEGEQQSVWNISSLKLKDALGA